MAEAAADELHLAAPLSVTKLAAVVSRLSASISIPLTVAADPAGLDELEALLDSGATRVVIKDTALADPDFIRKYAARFGSDAVSVAVEAQREGDYWRVVQGPERRSTEWEAVDWARVVEAQGGGELILTCLGSAGAPFALELLETVSGAVGIPVIGASDTVNAEDIFDALMIGDADGVLVAASALENQTALRGIKDYLADHGLNVRRD